MFRRKKKFESKISLTKIIKAHLATLRDINTNRPGWDDYFSFLILPILITGAFIFVGFDINENTIETLVGGLAIFVGLLFNAMVILLDLARKHDDQKIKIIIAKELTANISFAIILSFVAIFLFLLGFIDDIPDWAKLIIDTIGVFLLVEFFVIFLMILKRTYILFYKEIGEEF